MLKAGRVHSLTMQEPERNDSLESVQSSCQGFQLQVCIILWQKAQSLEGPKYAMIIFLCVLNSAMILLSAMLANNPRTIPLDSTFTVAIVHDLLGLFSISGLAAVALMSFISELSLKQLRTVGGKAAELSLTERKSSHFLRPK